MKLITVLPLLVLPSTYAWTFTWRDEDGKPTTERGRGPSKCISVDHAQGQLFKLDGQGEENINMLLFGTHDCSEEPVGSATESFSKESSVDILGFQVVALDEESTTTTKTGTATATSETPTGTHTQSHSTHTTTETGSETPTTSGSATATSTAESTSTSSAETTSSGGSESSPTATPTPTSTPGASSKLSPSGNGVLGIALGVVFAGAAWEWLI